MQRQDATTNYNSCDSEETVSGDESGVSYPGFMSARDEYYRRLKAGEYSKKKKKSNSPTKVLWSPTAGDVPQAAAISAYLSKLLGGINCNGTYTIKNYYINEVFVIIPFEKSGLCPVCMCTHDSYAFQYKVKPGVYGGWKCWKTNEWKTHYHYDSFRDLWSE